MTGGRPVRLTFPAYGENTTDILANGERVGIVVAGYRSWVAYLYRTRGAARIREGGEEEVAERRLADLRRVLRERVELKGPWWQ
jgi:hypothetical protein